MLQLEAQKEKSYGLQRTVDNQVGHKNYNSIFMGQNCPNEYGDYEET